VLVDKHARVVVLAARWDVLAEADLLVTIGGLRPSFIDSRRLFIRSLRKLLTALTDSGGQVILVVAKCHYHLGSHQLYYPGTLQGLG
jgi:hypothetical protein